ncbi:hypothetical protein IO90_15790 [Chryseobacterium sp. FH1]|nr:hypothetical protein IO90_15790 [Chryseobacterium sp. FH1]
MRLFFFIYYKFLIKKGNSEILSSKKWRKKSGSEKLHLLQNLILNLISNSQIFGVNFINAKEQKTIYSL